MNLWSWLGVGALACWIVYAAISQVRYERARRRDLTPLYVHERSR